MNLLSQSGRTGEVAVGDHASPCRPLLATPSPFPRWDGEEVSHSLGETSKLPHYEVPPSWGLAMAAAIILLQL